MTEAELAREVRKLCGRLGVRCYQTGLGRGAVGLGERGFPDLVMWGPAKLILRELKSDKGRSSLDQLRVGLELQGVGVDVALWRPVDLESGRIEHELREL